MPVIKTKGAASSQGFGEFAKTGSATYIEDVFSTWLYAGTGAAQTITNNINLSGKGGMVWIKSRSAATNHNLFDTNQGTTKLLHSNTTDATATDANSLTAFNTTGFTLGTGDTAGNEVNTSAATYASWTFREQPKFFDVVTYTGDGTSRSIAHNLGSVPGCMIVKCTSIAQNWVVYHRSLGNTDYLNLNKTQAVATFAYWDNTTPTSTVFYVNGSDDVNKIGATYVAYLFAHDAGGFGLTGTDNVISCGSYTTDGSGLNSGVSLGYEPQWIMYKRTDSSSGGGWYMQDNMRGMTTDGAVQNLFANTTAAESSGTYLAPTATGFKVLFGQPSATYIYIAIRRGPMKVPTDATTVFSPISSSSTAGTAQTTNFPVDVQITGSRTFSDADGNWAFNDRLRGVSTTSTEFQNSLLSTNTAAETAGGSNFTRFWNNTGFQIPSYLANFSSIYYNFQRAPNFFDEVCYTGTGTSAKQITHNLGISPNLIIVKKRSASGTDWVVYCSSLANYSSLVLDLTDAATVGSSPPYNIFGTNAQQTSTYITLGGSSNIGYYNTSGSTYVAYLFATCPGVSKVGTYTGNGSTQTINCGFTGGARFVLIKRTDAVGGWYVYDTARGMTTSTDPYILLNSIALESATLGSVTTVTTGFALNASILSAINTNAATYIFLAIA